MGQNGGVRPGAGRPKLFATKLAAAIVKKAEENAEELTNALYDKAVGKTDCKVDVQAMKELFDRGLGRALQNVDMTSNGETLNPFGEMTDEQLRKLVEARIGRNSEHTGGIGEKESGESLEVCEGAQEAEGGQ